MAEPTAEQNQFPLIAPLLRPSNVAALKVRADILMRCIKELRSGENILGVSKSVETDGAGPSERKEAWRFVAAEYAKIANSVSNATGSGIWFGNPETDAELEFMEQFLYWALEKYGGKEEDVQMDGQGNAQVNAQEDKEVTQALPRQVDYWYDTVAMMTGVILLLWRKKM